MEWKPIEVAKSFRKGEVSTGDLVAEEEDDVNDEGEEGKLVVNAE